MEYQGGPSSATDFWFDFRTPFWDHPEEPVLFEGSKWHLAFLERGLPGLPIPGRVVEANSPSIRLTVDTTNPALPKTCKFLQASRCPFNIAIGETFFCWVWRRGIREWRKFSPPSDQC